MGVALRDLTETNLYPLAAVVSLNPDQLHAASGRDKVVPSPAWLADQYRRIPGLPQTLLVPPILPMGAGIKAAQVVKRVVMAASGGADAVAAKAAANGIPLSNMLHPHATPTILCFAHKKLHPILMRDMFYYLTKEVADYADPVRRHPHHAHLEGDTTSPCQSREVRDWSYRMMGLSALWCTRHTFRCLDKGRQAPAPGYKAAKSKSRRQRQTSSSKATAEGTSSSSFSSSPRHRIRSNLRMPHMAFPCEVCILATIGSRCQALIDLRAGMLSRLLAEEAERVMRTKRHEEDGKKHSRRHKHSKGKSSSSHHRNASASTTATTASERASAEDFGAGFGSFKPKSYPHLWPLLDAYINAFGDEVASEIRRLSEALAKPLFMVRMCESSRCRHERREDRRIRHSRRKHSHSHSQSHNEPASQPESPPFVRVKQPPRMVTKNGHRLPLPLLPPKLDPWAKEYSSESEAGPSTMSQGPAEDGPDTYEGYADGYIDADGAFYAANQDLEDPASVSRGASQIMAGANEDGEAEYYYVAPEDEEDEDGEDHSAFLDSTRCDLAAAMQGSVPPWEEDYQRHIFDTQSELTHSAPTQSASNKNKGIAIVDGDRSYHSQHGATIVDGDCNYQEQQSFVSATVHSADPFEYDYGLCGRYAPAGRDRLSTIKDTPASEASSVSRGRRSKVPSSFVSDTQSSQASYSTLRPHPEPYVRPSNPEPPSSTASRASRSSKASKASEFSNSSHSRAPRSSASSKRTASTVTPSTPIGRGVSHVSSLSSTPSHCEYRPVSSIYSTQVEQQSAPYHRQDSASCTSSSRRTNHSTLAPSASTSRTNTTSTSSCRTPSTATSFSKASAAKVTTSSSRKPSGTPAASSVSSRLARPTAASQSRNATLKGTSNKQSAPSTAFVPPTNRRPSAPESYVAMQKNMSRSYAPSSSSGRHAGSKKSGATASTITVQAKATGARTPPSEVSTSSTLSSLYSGYAGSGIPSEIYDTKNETCSITPDDSISVVLTKKCIEEEQAQWEQMKREQREAERVLASQFGGEEALHSAEEVRWLQEQRRHPSSQRAAPMPPSAVPSPLFSRQAPATSRLPASNTHRNLNQYRPDASRRPLATPSGREWKPSQPKPPRARHRNPSNLTDATKLTEWPPVEWS
ncbi:hypothetical protein F503_05572 [Ophiostoma piceae UAMH 11346]|uniref:Uncharacterized protein n=1 Tax=Ophiostoma piceae (strain UAMH 11346) TaxID=1262450 RepID=S3CC43_OPHP1|nr:hypothetical protein F503_05572 [Ophiostoma piceae UAMH 11346]